MTAHWAASCPRIDLDQEMLVEAVDIFEFKMNSQSPLFLRAFNAKKSKPMIFSTFQLPCNASRAWSDLDNMASSERSTRPGDLVQQSRVQYKILGKPFLSLDNGHQIEAFLTFTFSHLDIVDP